MKQTKQTKSPQPQPAAAPKAAEYDWSNTGVTGFEATKTEDLGIPFLLIVQSQSPEINKAHKDYATKKIPGAEAGSIINTLSRQVVGGSDAPCIFIPCYYEKSYVEWRPRNSGGGYVAQHKDASILNQCRRSDEDNRDYLPNGNCIVTTSYFFGLNVTEEGDVEKCVISMTATQLKKARMWLNMMMQIKFEGPNGKFTPPMFSHSYSLTTTPEQNQDGSWFGWHVELNGPLNNKLIIEQAVESAKQMGSARRPQIAAGASADVPM